MKSDGFSEAFVCLFALNQRRVYSYILTLLPNRADADDVLQETSMVLWRKFEEFDQSSNFTAWACRIAYFEVLRFRRRKKPQELAFSSSVVELLATETASRSDELETRYQALSNCVKKLRPGDQELVALRYREQATIRYIAAEIGRPIEGLYKTYQRIRRSLVDCVDRALARECR